MHKKQEQQYYVDFKTMALHNAIALHKKFHHIEGDEKSWNMEIFKIMFWFAMTKVYKQSSLQPIFTQIKTHQLNSIKKHVFNFLHLFNPM